MRLCNFRGCERFPHLPSIPHALWNGDTQTWQPLAEQRTPAEQMRERRDRINRERAEKIAAAVIVAEHRRDGESFPRDWDDVQKIATAAALAALTEKENAR